MPQIKFVMLQHNKINKIPASLLPWVSSPTISISLEGNNLASEITELNEFRKSVKIAKGTFFFSHFRREKRRANEGRRVKDGWVKDGRVKDGRVKGRKGEGRRGEGRRGEGRMGEGRRGGYKVQQF